jgi:AraC-like DNA-binding protein
MSDLTGRPPDPAENERAEGDHRRPPRRRVAAYSLGEGTLAELTRSLRGSITVVPAADLDEMEGLLPASRAMVIRARVLDDSLGDWLRRVVDSFPLTPCFLVVDLTPENAGRVHDLGSGVRPVWMDYLSRLPGLIEEALSCSPLDLFLEAFRGRGGDSELVVQLVKMMCRDPSPPTTQKKLARLLGTTRKNVGRQWKRDVSETIPLKAFLDWVTSVRMVERAVARGWAGPMLDQPALAALGRDIGVSKRTLERLSKRCFGVGPAEILDRPLEALDAFEEWSRPILWTAR